MGNKSLGVGEYSHTIARFYRIVIRGLAEQNNFHLDCGSKKKYYFVSQSYQPTLENYQCQCRNQISAGLVLLTSTNNCFSECQACVPAISEYFRPCHLLAN